MGLGDVLGLPPEVMGIVVLGPMLSFNNFVMIPEKRKRFIWDGISGELFISIGISIENS